MAQGPEDRLVRRSGGVEGSGRAQLLAPAPRCCPNSLSPSTKTGTPVVADHDAVFCCQCVLEPPRVPPVGDATEDEVGVGGEGLQHSVEVGRNRGDGWWLMCTGSFTLIGGGGG